MWIDKFNLSRIPKVHFGLGTLSELARCALVYGNKALIVTGGHALKASGHYEKICASLYAAKIELHFLKIESEPTTQFIDEACHNLKNIGIDVVIGIGGGSVIDGAKAISAMLKSSNSILDHLEDIGKNIPHSGEKIPFIAIPTTSGTGGEMTKNAVISSVGAHGYKKSLRHENLIPDIVIVDPELMLSCPSHITAACGMDAFTQLLEPFLSPMASSLTDALALSGLEKIRDNLIPACTDKAGDISVRSGMAYASMLSGIVLANAGLGVVHGLASPIGGFFHIPHGVVCGTLVASATETNIKAIRNRIGEGTKSHSSNMNDIQYFERAQSKYAQVGILFGGNEKKGHLFNCEFLIEKLYAWTDILRLPKLKEYGILESDFPRIIEKTNNRNNPVPLNEQEIHQLLLRRL